MRKGLDTMSGVGAKFDRFLANIQLTQSQLDDAITKHTGVRRTLHAAYHQDAYTGSTSLLVGSYGKSTAVRPPSDIDILFKMPAGSFDRYNSYSGNGQSQLLQDVKNALLKVYPSTDIKGDGQVVVVPFASFTVEVVPAFARSTRDYYIANTHGGGSWKTTNPDEEMRQLTASNSRSQGNTVRLIKMLKVWKRTCNVPLKSLAVELMAAEFLSTWQYFDKSSIYYDWMLRDFFAFMPQRARSGALIPGTTEFLYYGDEWQSRAQSALARAKKACDYETNDKPESDQLATAEWQKIFGDFFVR